MPSPQRPPDAARRDTANPEGEPLSGAHGRAVVVEVGRRLDGEPPGQELRPFSGVRPAGLKKIVLASASVAAWLGLRAEDRGAAAVALHALRGRAARIVAGRCRCGIAVAEDHVADAVFVMVYGIRRAPRLRISATTTLAYLCGVARNRTGPPTWRTANP